MLRMTRINPRATCTNGAQLAPWCVIETMMPYKGRIYFSTGSSENPNIPGTKCYQEPQEKVKADV